MRSWSEDPFGTTVHPVAVVALVAVVAATLGAVVHFRPQAAQPEPAPTAQIASASPVMAPTGAALIDAVPWGRIERIQSADGEHLEIPPQRDTPLLLELPEGAWLIALSNPELDEERLCELTIVEGARDDCLIEFDRLTVDQYFREAGWWR